MSDTSRALITTSAVARSLGVSADRVRQLARSGALPYEQTDLGRLFDATDVAAFAERRRLRHLTLEAEAADDA